MAVVVMKLEGFDEVQKLLRKLPDKAQERAVKPALRKMTKRLHGRVVQSFSGMPIGVVTASILTAFIGAKIRLQPGGRRRGMIKYTLDIPTDREDAIAINALEYGWTDRFGNQHPARAAIRTTVDAGKTADLAILEKNIKKGIERQAKRLGKKK